MSHFQSISCSIYFCLFLVPSFLLGQLSISGTAPSSGSLTICQDTAVFSYKIEANGINATGVSIDIHIVQGLTLIPATLVVGTGSQSISYAGVNNNILTFSAADLGINDSLVFSYGVIADCNALSRIQTTNIFQDTLLVNYNGGIQDDYYTSNYANAIIYPELSLFSPDAPSAAVGEVSSRSVNINNNGNGCIGRIEWYDAYGSDVSVDSIFLNGVKLNHTTSGDTVYYTFTAADFQLIGNGDGEFCSDELSFSIVEYLTLLGCNDRTSSIGVSWGCGGIICDTYTTNSGISNEVETPNLVFTWKNSELPECYHEQANTKEVVVTNTGSGTAHGISMEIKKFYYGAQWAEYRYDGIDQNSVEMKVGDGTFQSAAIYHVETNNVYTSCSQGYAYRFDIDLPNINVGDSVVIRFDMINCRVDDGPQPNVRQGAIGYDYSYTNACNDNTWASPNRYASSIRQITTSFVSLPFSSVAAGQTADFVINLSSSVISFQGDGRFILTQVLPDCGVSFSGLEWKNSIGNMSWSPNTIQQNNDTVKAEFDVVTMPSGFDLNGSNIELEVMGVCNCTDAISARSFKQQIDYVPDTGCSSLSEINVFETTGTVSVDVCSVAPCDGPEIKAFSIERINLDESDTDLNRRPEATAYDMSIVRTDRARIGDTLEAKMTAVVDGGNGFEVAYFEINVDSGQFISAVSGDIIIWDEDKGNYINCNNIPVSESIPGKFVMDISPDSIDGICSLFIGHKYETGDSIIASVKLLVSGRSEESIINVNFNPVNIFMRETPADTLINCGSGVASGQVQLIGILDETIYNYLYSNSCDSTVARTFIRQYIGNDKVDVFPGEYRIWNYPDTIFVQKPTDFEYKSAYILLRFNPYVIDHYPVPIDVNGDSLVFDIGSLFENGTFIPPDDGYELRFFTTWQPTCASYNDSAISVPTRVVYEWDEGLKQDHDSIANYRPEVRHAAASLNLTNVSFQTQDGISKEVNWTFRMLNQSQKSDAINPWFNLDSKSGLITVNRVYDETNGVDLTPVGEIYQLTDFEENEFREYTIYATFEFCSNDTLDIKAGWDCEGYPTTVQDYACNPTEFFFVVDPKPAAGNITINSQPASSVNLCTSFPIELNLATSLIADVMSPALDVLHPSGGFNYDLGSLEIEYPIGSGFVSVSDPTPITGGFRVSLNDYLSAVASEGLPGLRNSDASLTSVNIRFGASLNCDFVSGDIFYMYLNGVKPCGDSIATYLAVSDPVNVSGISIPYSSSIDIDIPTIQYCGNTVAMKVKSIIAGGSTSGGDQVFVTIPDGISYDLGSFVNIHNGPDTSSISITDLGQFGKRLEMDLNAGISAGDSVVFSLAISADYNSSCLPSESFTSVSMVFEANVSCGALACNQYQASTGLSSQAIGVEKPDLKLSDLYARASLESSSIEYLIIGTLVNEGIDLDTTDVNFIEFYCDKDNDETYSVSDSLIGYIVWEDQEVSDGSVIETSGNPIILDKSKGKVRAPTWYTNDASLKAIDFQESFTVSNLTCGTQDEIIAVLRSVSSNSESAQCLCEPFYASSTFDVTLPVELLSFKASQKQNDALVEWSTGEEINHDYFLLQRSLTGQEFKAINKIQGTGEVQGPHQYHFTDKKVANFNVPQLFYRLKQVDFNGASTLSNIIELNIIKGKTPLSIFLFPNPANGIVKANYAGTVGTFILQVRNSLGQIQFERNIESTPGNQSYELRVDDYAPGIYYAEIKNNGRNAVFKFFVK